MKLLAANVIALTLSPCALALGEHEFDWGSRARYAHVDADNSGQAASLLLRGSVESEWTDIVSSTLEIDAVGTVLKDDHSDGERFNNEPLIPDPQGADINQAFLSFNLDVANIHLGRQRINFDNQRFIGGNGFWQNEQTFDAVLGKFKLASNSNLTYSYIANANRIYGDDADESNSGREHDYENAWRPAAFLGDHKHHSHLARLEWNEWDYTRVVGYGYRIDNRDMPSVSNNTLGASYTLNYKASVIKYRVQIEAAQQNRSEVNADNLPYYLVDLGFGINTWELSTRYEILGANDGAAFITPLGSNHDFEGWADEIGNTPNSGVRNFSLGLLWRASPLRVETSYHFFKDDVGGNNIGREFDLDFVYKPARKHSVSLRLANFEPEGDSGSVRKVYLDYSFNL
ncbi:MAG TPA: hypothetical protein DIW64_21080 [Cellvibrio sp.]|nr:hypothetical protein [Cellvibrio sp.]